MLAPASPRLWHFPRRVASPKLLAAVPAGWRLRRSPQVQAGRARQAPAVQRAQKHPPSAGGHPGGSAIAGRAPWTEEVWGAPQSTQALKALQASLGMSGAEFATLLGGHPAIYMQPASLLQHNANQLARQLGGRAQALKWVRKHPGALALGGWRDNFSFLMEGLGWTMEEAVAFANDQPLIFSQCNLAGPMAQHGLQLCHAVMGLDATTVLMRHAADLRARPDQIAPRLAFIAFRKLAPRLVGAGARNGVSTAFFAEAEPEWVARLGRWGVSRQEWREWEAAHRKSDAWQWLLAADADYDAQLAKVPVVEQALRDAVVVIAPPPAPGTAADTQAEQGGSDNGSAGATAHASTWRAGACPAGSRLKYKVAGLRVCCRGRASISRAQLKRLLQEAGATVQPTVGPSTDVLFCEDAASGSAMAQKGRNCAVVPYTDLLC